jgi:branched-subunit amino acid transport protein
MTLDWLYAVSVVVGLLACSVLTRGVFIIPKRAPPLPERVKLALRYAPIAALMAVIAPEILLPSALGVMWVKLGAAVAAGVYFYTRKGILGTIVVGMAVYALLRFVVAPHLAPAMLSWLGG